MTRFIVFQVELGGTLDRSRPMMVKSSVWLAVAGVAFAFCALAAGWMALRLIRSNRAALISTLPVLPEQTVAVESPGEIVVSIEVPRLTTEYRRWEIEAVENSTGRTHTI